VCVDGVCLLQQIKTRTFLHCKLSRCSQSHPRVPYRNSGTLLHMAPTLAEMNPTRFQKALLWLESVHRQCLTGGWELQVRITEPNVQLQYMPTEMPGQSLNMVMSQQLLLLMKPPHRRLYCEQLRDTRLGDRRSLGRER